jgi:hypothetical protein
MTTAEVNAETSFDKIKEAFRSLSISDIRPIILSSIHTMQDVGEYSEACGQLEKKNKDAYDLMARLGEQPETILMQFIDKIPNDKLKPLIALSLKLTAIQERLKNFQSLSADEKITLGRELKTAAIALSKLVEELP